MKALNELDASEADRWIIKARQALASHARSMATAKDAGEFRSAMEAILGNLGYLAEHHPGKRSKIQALISHYRGHASDA